MDILSVGAKVVVCPTDVRPTDLDLTIQFEAISYRNT
jgi:hypothetical protein